eukprot:GEMP01022600.1.p1 GENE.GEMP01022600.1~~GEMP01022600.1.p1  ORF type:complete len:511 (+),score=116.21 GEMP01022600.1:14-1546(+)
MSAEPVTASKKKNAKKVEAEAADEDHVHGDGCCGHDHGNDHGHDHEHAHAHAPEHTGDESHDHAQAHGHVHQHGEGCCDHDHGDHDQVEPSEEKKGDEDLTSTNQLMHLLRRSRICEDSRRYQDRPHQFWDTQPVPTIGSEPSDDCGPIDAIKTPGDCRDEPYALPPGFEWVICNVDNDVEAREIYQLLSDNYVEDDDNMFRFEYSVDFLKWAMQPPGFRKDWHLGVRATKGTKKTLVGFITAIPAVIQVYDDVVKMVEINFLCVHKKLRSKRLAPVLIKEITRRVNKQDIWQAVYTAGVVLPRPISECRYYHRSLNPKKLIEVGFSHLGPRMTMARTLKLFKLSDKTHLEGMRKMTDADVDGVHELLTNYLKKFPLHPIFTKEELRHWILPREGVVNAYVREIDGVVRDFSSFYALPSSILGNEKYSTLKAAYCYWNVATSVPFADLMLDTLILARNDDFDVFNALNVMENDSFLKTLKFGIGDGFLQYYLYNWKCPKIEPSGIGLVLL